MGSLSCFLQPGTRQGVWEGLSLGRPGAWGLLSGVRGLAPPAGTHTLQLARVRPSDSGIYACEALNAAGRDQKLVQLSVLGMSCLSPTPSVSPQPRTPRRHGQERGSWPWGSLGCPHSLSSVVGRSWSVELDTPGLRLSCMRICTVTLGKSLSLSEPQASHL